MKKFTLWAYDHPLTSGLLTGIVVFVNQFLTDLTGISIGILATFVIVLLIGMRQSKQRYDSLLKFAQTVLIPKIQTPWPPNDDPPEVGDLPPNLANDPNENYERSERIRLGLFYKSPLNTWTSIGDGYQREKLTYKRPVK